MKFFILYLVLFFTTLADAKFTLPNVIYDGMVLQRDTEAVVWGWSSCKAGSAHVRLVGVTAVSVEIQSDGSWEASLPVMSGSTAAKYDIVINDCDSTVTVKNVVFGDVLLCSGQSNMAWPLKKSTGGSKAISEYDPAKVRFFVADKTLVTGPKDDVSGTSRASDIGSVSAVCYFAAMARYEKLGGKIPIGIVVSAVGGSAIELWMDNDATRKCKRRRLPKSTLWDGMIVPLLKMRFSAVLWYQGEKNSKAPGLYECLFPVMIKEWRERFNLPNLPFHFVELASFQSRGRTNLAVMRRAQRQATKKLPNVYAVTAVDVGMRRNVHSPLKQPVGERLAQSIAGEFTRATGTVTKSGDLVFSGTGPLRLVPTNNCNICCKVPPVSIRIKRKWRPLRDGEWSINGNEFEINTPRPIVGVLWMWDSFVQCALVTSDGNPVISGYVIN